MRKKAKTLLIILFVFLCICAFWYSSLIVLSGRKTDLSYCKDIARTYSFMHLEQFDLDSISYNNEEDIIVFDFYSKSGLLSLSEYSKDKTIHDLAKIRTEIVQYLTRNPDNELNSKKIKMIFNTYPDDYMLMCNYDLQNDKQPKNAYDFMYFQGVSQMGVDYLIENDPHYCKELAITYNSMRLTQFNFYRVKWYYREDVVEFHFSSRTAPPSLREYSDDKAIQDLAKIRTAIVKYLTENPDNELNGKRIRFLLDTYPGDYLLMCNYDFENDKQPKNAYDFMYFQFISQKDIDYLLQS